jgi:Predicted periplasmic solute-binding protein
MDIYFSPCPNDTFCFHAMVSGLVDTEGLEFTPCLEDVEQLNNRVLTGDVPLCKISYHCFLHVAERYAMLPCGSALGFGNGPLLVARRPDTEIGPHSRIAIPGVHTTAALLLALAYPQARQTTPLLFSEIAPAVQAGDFDAGVLIHEGRFTYARHGLHLVADLGACWEARTGLPIPLGGIAVSRSLEPELSQKLARVLRRSIAYALEHPRASRDYVRLHAQEMDEDVIQNHIRLFVNDYTLDIGPLGQAAVDALLDALKHPVSG